jgi:hypothetical protein
MKKNLILLSLIPLLFSGCAGYGTITRNLSKDGAIVRVVTPYGVFTRVGTTTNSVRITTNGDIYINEVQD